jgi:DNA-binding CsgD family transcriptional regulator
MDNLAFCDHLYDESTDGYIQIIQLQNGKAIKIYNTVNKALRTIVEEVKGQEDFYISPNTYYKPKRSVSCIRQFRALYADLDVEKFGRYEKSETIYMINDLVYQDKIPAPSMTIFSGRGIHLYWKIKNAPYGAIQTWQELEDYIYSNLKQFGADVKATDGARVLRLPNTINSRSNAECKILSIDDDIEYSMYDLREKYLDYKPKAYQLKIHQVKEAASKSKKCINNKFFNSYSLHYARIEDIKTLCELRDYEVEYHRNFILHCYAYWEGIYTRDPEELKNRVIELNNSFKKPLRQTEVDAVLRCIPKAIEKFINYEQGLNNGQTVRVSNGMKLRGGYWYKNETLIEKLEITSEEQKHMKTIIGTEEKYRRNNIKRTPRNAAGLTSREQQKQNKIKEVQALYINGLKQKEIAQKLNISRQLVNHYMNLIKK